MKTRPDDLVHDSTSVAIYNSGKQSSEIVGGLTKREYFAALALTGSCSVIDKAGIAKDAVKMADELIKALNEGNENETGT